MRVGRVKIVIRDIVKSKLLIYENDLLQIIVLGGIRLESLDRFRVTLKVNYEGKTLRHNLDLYNDDQVEKFIKKVCNRLDLGSREVQEILDELTEELETYRLEQMESTTPNKPTVKQLTEREKEKAKKCSDNIVTMAHILDAIKVAYLGGDEEDAEAKELNEVEEDPEEDVDEMEEITTYMNS